MKMFNDMSLEEAKDLYEKLQVEQARLVNKLQDVSFIKNALDNLCFYTDGFRKDYGMR